MGNICRKKDPDFDDLIFAFRNPTSIKPSVRCHLFRASNSSFKEKSSFAENVPFDMKNDCADISRIEEKSSNTSIQPTRCLIL